MMDADDVADELGVSKGKAYKIIKELNKELEELGYITISGKLPRAFWDTRFYGPASESGLESRRKEE